MTRRPVDMTTGLLFGSTLHRSVDPSTGLPTDSVVVRKARSMGPTTTWLQPPPEKARSTRGDKVSARSTLARPKAKKKGKPLALLPVANACSVLAVDPADRSGFAMWTHGGLVEFGEVDLFSTEPAAVLDRFLQLPGPHVICIERPFMIRFGGQSALATGDKIWRVLAKRAGFGKRVVRVYPSTWRSKVLPKGMAAAKRDVVRPVEHAEAGKVAACFGLGSAPMGSEAAPAVLIGKWGSFSAQVAAVLPKPRKARAAA